MAQNNIENIVDKFNLDPDLSYIDNMEDLDNEIERLKRSVSRDQAVLKAGFRQIPRQALKGTVGKVAPFMFKQTKTGQAYNIGKVTLGFLMSKPWKRANTSKEFANYFKILTQEIGLPVIVKGITSIFKRKRKK